MTTLLFDTPSTKHSSHSSCPATARMADSPCMVVWLYGSVDMTPCLTSSQLNLAERAGPDQLARPQAPNHLLHVFFKFINKAQQQYMCSGIYSLCRRACTTLSMARGPAINNTTICK